MEWSPGIDGYAVTNFVEIQVLHNEMRHAFERFVRQNDIGGMRCVTADIKRQANKISQLAGTLEWKLKKSDREEGSP